MPQRLGFALVHVLVRALALALALGHGHGLAQHGLGPAHKIYMSSDPPWTQPIF